ncbi:MFS transporter [Niveispirillum fermenti]|uniref:MFS transporter n=1 Tax=Niveispirillum fermenti TaxID=1233113 RepID=UPI003A8B8173
MADNRAGWLWLLPAMVAATLIMGAALGTRQSFGLYIAPFSFDHGVPVTLIAFAIALHNLVWGLSQPLAGAAADRWGGAPVVGVGALFYAAGLALSALRPEGSMLILGLGLLVGLGVSCTSFGVVMTAVGKAVTPERRSMAMGLASAGGSAGQALLVPLAQAVDAGWGMAASLLVLAAIILVTAPLGLLLDRRRPAGPVVVKAAMAPPPTTLRTALAEAGGHAGYRMLTLGFFTCGFQLAFILTHLPGYLVLCQMPAGLAATALAAIGLFNMGGSWLCGWLGGRYRQPQVLGWLYLVRGGAIAAFVFLPKSEVSVLLFAAVMGVLWLGTVPLTSGLVARLFGARHLGALFGVCFLSHQIGAFLGSWAGGLVFDLTGSYTPVWIATVVMGLAAAALHFPIDDRPVARPAYAGP